MGGAMFFNQVSVWSAADASCSSERAGRGVDNAAESTV